MKARIIAFVLLFALASFSSSQAGNDNGTTITIEGSILDDSGEPLAGVAVKIAGFSQVFYTDFDGHFEIPVPKTGKVSLKLSSVSYEEKDVLVEPAKMNDSKSLTIQLEKTSIL